MNLNQIYTDEFIRFVQDHLTEDPAQLLLRYAGKVAFDLKFAIQQIQARQKAKTKLPSWCKDPRLIFPPTLSVEQASSEVTARLKATFVKGNTMIDLTGGLGVDTFYLATKFNKAYYFERNSDLKDIATYNFNVLSPGKFETTNQDSISYLKDSKLKFDLLYLDPARRGIQNQKLYKLADCEPDTVKHWELLTSKSEQIFLKASPMLDLKQAWEEIPELQQAFVIAVKNEVKEVLFSWKKEEKKHNHSIQCINILQNGNQNFEFSLEEEALTNSEFGEVQKYLIEPNAAILKAGAFKTFGTKYGLKKLHPNSHLFTTESVPDEIPGRVFEVTDWILQPKKDLSRLIPNGIVNVITRNYAISSDNLKKKYKLKDGGKSYLIGTKSQSGYILLLNNLV